MLAGIISQPESHILTAQAVRSWTLLLTSVNVQIVKEQEELFEPILYSTFSNPVRLSRLTDDLAQHNLELAQAIGEAVVVINELDDNFQIDDETIAVVEELATESNKHKV